MGALTDKAGQVANAFANFATAFNAAVAKKRANASQSDNASLIGGKNSNDFLAGTNAVIAAHKATDEHGVTAAQLNVFTKPEMTVFSDGYPTISDIPFVSFGSMNKAPVDVSGAFSGASDGASVQYGLNLEEDGTLVVLRNGTDGSKFRTYLGYVPDAVLGTMQRFTRSTTEFRPSSVPANKYIGYTYVSGEDAIVSRLYANGSSVAEDVAIFLPNGSYLKPDMPTAFVTKANWALLTERLCSSIIIGEYLYLIGMSWVASVEPVRFSVWRIPLSAFNGGYVVPEKVTGWSITTRMRTNVVTDDILMFEKIASADPAVDTMVLVDRSRGGDVSAHNVFHNITSVVVGKKNNRYARLRVASNSYYAYGPTGWSFGPGAAFSFVIDFENKTAVLDECGAGRETVTTNYDGNNGVSVTRNGYHKYDKVQLIGANFGNSAMDMGIIKNGMLFSITGNSEFDNARQIHRATFKDAASSDAFDAIKFGATIIIHASCYFLPVYGSPLGSKFYGVVPFSDNGLFVAASGREPNGGTMRGLVRVINDASQPDYQHVRLDGSSIQGYGPSTDRTFVNLAEGGKRATQYASCVCEIDETGYLTHGSYFVNSLYSDGLGEIDSNGFEKVPGKRVYVDPIIYNKMKLAIQAALPTIADSMSEASFTIFFPKRLPRAYGVLLWRRADNKNTYLVLFEFKVTGGDLDTAVNDIEVTSISPHVHITGNNGTGVSVWAPEETGGVTIYKVGNEGYAIGLTTRSYYGIVGGAGSPVLKFFVSIFSDKEPQVEPDWPGMKYHTVYPYLSGRGYTAIKGIGFGTYEPTDNYTKLVFGAYQNTKAAFIAETYSGINRILATQELAQGWDVYFTNANRVMIAGVIKDVPATSFNLKNIDAAPQNKTFYVYLKCVNGSVSYEITKQKVAESYSFVQIGTIVTGANSINSINISKAVMAGNIVRGNI